MLSKRPNPRLQRTRAAVAAEPPAVRPTMSRAWKCPNCERHFTRTNQRHACGTGSRSEVLRNRSPEIVALYASLERFVKTLGPVEFVTRDRYVLLRSNRIFADLVVMAGALRAVVHLPRRVADPLFMKVGADQKRVSHVAMLRSKNDLETLKPYLKEAYQCSIAQTSA
jgi:hypothetical protein